jgi:O-acetyl-ADP-ribose deacetylase (regulator of RNase III)
MGQVVWTSAGTLKAKHVAHAIAALDGAICLQRTTLRTLLGAEQRGATSVVMPALGTGVGEVPMALGAKLMLEAFRTFASLRPEHVRAVRVVLFNEEASVQWREVLRSM